jgi:thiol-disulfide isomerase/thioredoxin
MKPSIPLILAAALVGGLLGLFAQHYWQPSAANTQVSSSIHPGEPMPALVLSNLDGKPVHLPADFAGRPLLINFWASWCEPCLREMPELDRYSCEQGGNGAQIIGIALDTPEAVRGFLARTPVTYLILLDLPGPTDASMKLGDDRGLLPYSVLIGTDGHIVQQKTGPFAPGEINSWVRNAKP